MKNKLPDISLSALPFINRPYILLFAITQRCNLRCSYCFGQYYSEKEEMTFSEIKKIFKEFYGLGVRRIGISGGEPLLHKDIDKVIKMAVNMGFNVGLNSNGILVPLHLEALKLVDNLSISLDGATEKKHDKYRGKGSFQKAIAGIEAAANAGIPIHLCCTLTDANLDEWPKLLDLARKYKGLVQISPLYPRFRGEGGLKLAKAWEAKIKKTLKQIIKQKDKGNSNLFFSKDTYNLIFNWKDFTNDISNKYIKDHPVCLAGKKIVALDCHGNLFPCTRLTEVVQGQNCIKLGVKKAYQNIAKAPCKSCRWACYIEYNSLLNLRLSAVKNLLQNKIQIPKIF